MSYPKRKITMSNSDARTMFHVNASLFAAANLMRSYEETRYYLNGVYVEPCEQGGVLLVATDGHRLIVIRDENGFTPEPVIIQVDKGELKKFKPDSRATKQLVIEDISKFETIPASLRWIDEEDGQSITFDTLQVKRVNGTFPDWRRIMPRQFKPGASHQSFNADYIASFGKARTLIGEAFGFTGKQAEKGRVTFTATDHPRNPCLIGLPGYENIAFGVLMPMQGDMPSVPAWSGVQPMVEEPEEKQVEEIKQAA